MEYLKFFVLYFYLGAPYGIALAIFWFFFKVAARRFPKVMLFQMVRMVFVKRKAMKVERFGYKVFCYISWADGKKIRVKDMEKENLIQVKDPLIFEHHEYKDLPFVLNEKFLFYNSKKLNIVGYFHRINSKDKEVFNANLVEINIREEPVLRNDK